MSEHTDRRPPLSQPLAMNPYRARRWLRARNVRSRLPRRGHRLLVMTETDAVVIEQRTSQEYLFMPVRNRVQATGEPSCAQ
jgi:hypothetical protein